MPAALAQSLSFDGCPVLSLAWNGQQVQATLGALTSVDYTFVGPTAITVLNLTIGTGLQLATQLGQTTCTPSQISAVTTASRTALAALRAPYLLAVNNSLVQAGSAPSLAWTVPAKNFDAAASILVTRWTAAGGP